MQSEASGCEGQAGMAGYIGTSVRTWGGGGSFATAVPTPTQQSKSVPRPAAWGVRGKPNELKRLDVPVSDPTSRAAARHQKRKCNSSRRQPVHFVQGWSIFCLLSITSKRRAVSSPAVSAAVVKQHHKDPIKTAPQTCPASTFTYSLAPLSRTSPFVCIALYCTCIVSHCVAVACQSASLDVSIFLIDILWVPIFFTTLSHFPLPNPVSPPYISPSTQSPIEILLPLFSLLLPLSPSLPLSPPRSFS